MKPKNSFKPDSIGAYFRMERLPLAFIVLSGLVYNIGLVAMPWFEGKLAQTLSDILGGNTAASAMAGVKRIDAFLAQEERRMAAERGGKAPEGDVVLSHVVFGYDERIVLNDISFTVKQGEQVTLVGRTGAGKSTIFKLLLGLYKPNSGTITIGGRDAADIAETEARVLDALRRASAGRTVFSISHSVYESLGGRIIQVQAAS